MLKVFIIGYGQMASSLVLGSVEAGHKVVGAINWEHRPKNIFKRCFYSDKYKALLKSYKIPLLKEKSVNSESFRKKIVELNPDVILIGSWGEILKKETFMLPVLACINCHPSLLPKHRGSNPYISVLKEGEQKTGITFHLVDEKIDSGPIMLQKEIAINENDTGGLLKLKCAQLARESVAELLQGIAKGSIEPVEQNHEESSYYPMIGRDDVMIDWSKSAKEIYDHIRSLNPWHACYALHNNDFVKIRSGKIVELSDDQQIEGKILQKKKNSIVVSTGSKNQAIEISDLKMYGFLPAIWGNFYINHFIKQGDVFK